jgi:hypothetical protein
MGLSRIERKQTIEALERCGWTAGEYDPRDIVAGRNRERQLIAEAEREAERRHAKRMEKHDA